LLTCKDFLHELSDYLDQSLDADIRTKLESHISECPNCWVIADTTRKMDPYPVPADVQSRLMQALERKIAAKQKE
jgi:anti-sigma factor RsiW